MIAKKGKKEMGTPIKVEIVAQWFVNRAILDVQDGKGEYISLLKLQKLLYYSQGCYGVIQGKKLFDTEFVHQRSGPTIQKITDKYIRFAINGINLWQDDIDIEMDKPDIHFLQNIYLLFGQYSTWRLSEMTVNELPWSTTKQDEKITFESMVKYFKIYHDDRLNTMRIRDPKVIERAVSLRDRGILDDDFIIKNFYKYF
ncbi:MAG: DUF4065 domain-containing protein [Firmicutes bacterium]|nr:DUF4065 domain-containing protein [Bacillota bacterium]